MTLLEILSPAAIVVDLQGETKEEIIGLAVASEKDGFPGLAAGIFHHISLVSLGTEDASVFANRSMRLREEANDLEGMIYGHALLAHIAKESNDYEVAQTHLRKRLEIIPDSESFEKMEALADLAHCHATVGELVDEMRPYGRKFKEIGIICDFMDSNLTWFERVYAFGRADIIKFLRAEGRNI